jgi:hypothetical protein
MVSNRNLHSNRGWIDNVAGLRGESTLTSHIQNNPGTAEQSAVELTGEVSEKDAQSAVEVDCIALEDTAGPLFHAISWDDQLLIKLWNAKAKQLRNREGREYGGWLIHRKDEGELWYTKLYMGLGPRGIKVSFVDNPAIALATELKIYSITKQAEFLKKNPDVLLFHSHAYRSAPSTGHSDSDIKGFLLGKRNVNVVVTPSGIYALIKSESTISSNDRHSIGVRAKDSKDDWRTMHREWIKDIMPLSTKYRFFVYWSKWPLIDEIRERKRHNIELLSR